MNLTEYLTPDIFSHYKDILPLLFQALDDATDEVKEKSCGALEAFCEELGSEILPYLEPLLAKLLHLLQNSKDRETQETALSAISSTANAAGSVIRELTCDFLLTFLTGVYTVL